MIYSINEGLLDKFKKSKPGNTTRDEFENALNNMYKCFKALESNETKFLGVCKSLQRWRDHENNDLNRIRKEFNSKKSTYIIHHMILRENYKNNDDQFYTDDFLPVMEQFVKSCGFKNIDTDQDGNTYLIARDSDKYPSIVVELSYDSIIDISIFYDKNPVILKAENVKNESSIFESVEFV